MGHLASALSRRCPAGGLSWRAPWRPDDPVTPERTCLPLLPSGSDGVRSLRRTGSGRHADCHGLACHAPGDGPTMVGGEGGIRTHEAACDHLHALQACSFNRARTPLRRSMRRTSRETMAERVGFEPTCPVRDNPISSRTRYDLFGTSPSPVAEATFSCFLPTPRGSPSAGGSPRRFSKNRCISARHSSARTPPVTSTV